jgi:hypothetical protein
MPFQEKSKEANGLGNTGKRGKAANLPGRASAILGRIGILGLMHVYGIADKQ